MFYLHQMGKRRERDWQHSVLAVNQGLATWYDKKAHSRFQRLLAKSQQTGAGLTGVDLERAVMAEAMKPGFLELGYVVIAES